MDKQIEEMARIIADNTEQDTMWDEIYASADILYTAGYRKQSENLVEVVRCKDCKYYRAYEPPIEDFDGWCSVNENEYDKEFYCQYGKKGGE